MTITTSSYTTNSLRINVSNETSPTNIIVAINQGMVKGGWILYDQLIAGGAGNQYSPVSIYVYRALNVDGNTFKYIILRINTINLTLNTSSCESWDLSGHSPVNETWHGSGSFVQGFDLKDSIILVSATPRHCVIWTFIRSEPGMWTGVFEFERVAGEDVSTSTSVTPVPCWAWTNSLMLGTPFGQPNNTVSSQIMMSFPRAPDGSVGAAAARIYAPMTNRGMFPPYYSQGITTQQATLDPNRLHLGSYYGSGAIATATIAYGWDALKTIVSPISADAMLKVMPVGRAYNVGITKPLGGALDTTIINLDNTGGWPSASTTLGTATECLLLPLNGGCEQDWAGGTAYGSFSTGTNAVYGQGGNVVIGKGIPIGSQVWLATNQGVYTWDSAQGQGSGLTLRYLPPATDKTIWDIIHDGSRTIYASTGSGIVAIDTETFASTPSTSVINTGTSWLGIDQKYVYAASRTSGTQAQVYSFWRGTGGSGTFLIQTSTYTISSATTVATGFGVPTPDYVGGVYVATQPGVPIANFMYISKFNPDTGNELVRTFNPKYAVGGATIAVDSPSSFYIDTAANRTYFVAGGIGGLIYELSTTTLSTLTNAQAVFGGAFVTGQQTWGSAMSSGAAASDYRGDMNIVPFRGQFLISPKKIGFSASTGYFVRALFNYPFTLNATGPTAPAGLPFPINSGTTNITAQPTGFGGVITSNGVRIIASWCQTAASDNRIYAVNGLHNVAYTAQGYSNGRLVVKG